MTGSTRQFRDMSIDAFTTALASGQPVPGGGSAAAVAAALAASLSSMVVRLSLDRPAFSAHGCLHEDALATSDAARAAFLGLADDDAAAYGAYRDARRMPHASADESAARDAATRQAARISAEVPLTVVDACRRQVELVERLAGRTNPHAASDLDVAALLLQASAHAAAANVLVNLPAIGDDDFTSASHLRLERDLRQVEESTARVREFVAAGGQRPPETA
jgi:formiminotetrahydrofolate cyclodeaminase